MNDFKNFKIDAPSPAYVGKKIEIYNILNAPIIVEKFKIEESRFKDKGSGKRLTLQLDIDGEKRILFSGSVTLMEMVKKVPDNGFPFKAKIVKRNDRFEFT